VRLPKCWITQNIEKLVSLTKRRNIITKKS